MAQPEVADAEMMRHRKADDEVIAGALRNSPLDHIASFSMR
jgi:hypothetical protein